MSHAAASTSPTAASKQVPSIVDEENPFTGYYGQLLHQGNMLQDYVRTGAYQQAVLRNPSDFKDKVVMDVGTGTGILSFFAAQAGARKVYAVEASASATIAKKLADANGFGDRIEIVRGKVEEVTIPEKVDVIISEPIGFLLVHERMLESYAAARDRFLKPGGTMYPATGSIFLCPYTDNTLYQEQLTKIQFWENNNFYGVDLSPVIEHAYEEYFSQPVVGYFPPSCLVSSIRTVHTVDFLKVTCEELQTFEIGFSFRIDKTCILHGLGGWFDIAFLGTDQHVVLSTSPESPGTHWYQCRLMLREPIAVNKGQSVSGKLVFVANEKFSYNMTMTVSLDGTEVSSTNTIRLHDQMYHYLTSSTSGTDAYGSGHGHS